MHFSKVIDQIIKNINLPLPGINAHIEMSPPNRPVNFNNANSFYKESGVTILLYPKLNKTYSVLIERPVYKGIHSGQISLPGGKKEEVDNDLIETALRETEEEIGIKKENINLIGNISELYIEPSNFMVLPVVAYLNFLPDFIIDTNEVKRILEYDIEILKNESLCKTKIFNGANYSVEAPYYDINGYAVWGATAMILSEFKKLF